MTTQRLILMSLILIITSLTTSSRAFIASPLDWAFAPNLTRGLVCPSLRYGCCPDLATWRYGSPCESPKATSNPEHCYEKKVWACCQVEVPKPAYMPIGVQTDSD